MLRERVILQDPSRKKILFPHQVSFQMETIRRRLGGLNYEALR